MESTVRRPTVAIIAITILVVVESLMFLTWAPLHLGLEIPLGFTTLIEPPIRPAFIVETTCGLALALSALALFTHRRWAGSALIIAHIVAFLGVLLGMTALALGRGPRTVSNDIYHNVMMLLLMTNLILLQRPGVQAALEAT
jgi:hypothetical protein